jgi:hypothetical protein
MESEVQPDPASHRLVRRLETVMREEAERLGYVWEFCHIVYRNDTLPRIEMEFRPTDNRCYA